MPRRTPIDPAAPFQTIDGTAKITGLAAGYIRRGIKAGTIPAIRIGEGAGTYMVDVQLFLQQLHDKAASPRL